jgi:hypothetical protein
MTAKKGDRAAPPAGPEEWEVRFADNEAAKGWEELCRQAPGNTSKAWLVMRNSPEPPSYTRRHHRLRDRLATKPLFGRVLDHWQIEVTGAGRIWYLVDTQTRTIWIDYAGTAHPKRTE